MKKLLGWTIALTAIESVVYLTAMNFGALAEHAFVAAFIAAAFIAVAAFSITAYSFITSTPITVDVPEDALFPAGVAFAAVGAAFGSFVDIVPVALLALLMTALTSREMKVKFRYVSLVYLGEGAGVYGTLTLNAWWPAAIAVAVLGVWWLAFRTFERPIPATSI